MLGDPLYAEEFANLDGFQRAVTLENIRATAAVGRKKCAVCLSGRRIHRRARVRSARAGVDGAARAKDAPNQTDAQNETAVVQPWEKEFPELLESLQCRLLAAGLHVRVIALHRLRSGVYGGRRNRNPHARDTFDEPDAIWANDAVRFGADLATPLGGALGARFARASCDRCVAAHLDGATCVARRRRCTAAQFCAPLHGCVAREGADARRPAAELGWVAPPRRAAEESRTAVAEMRFVYGSGGWKRKSARKVTRHRWNATRDIARALMRPPGDAGAPVIDEDGALVVPGSPVLLTESAASQWPLLALSWAQLRRELARFPIESVHVAPAAAASRRCFASPDYFAQMTRGPCDAAAPGAVS